MKKFLTSVIFTIFLFTGVNSAFAVIRVQSVKGRAAYKIGRRWRPIRRGIKLVPGVKISTGVRSRVVLKINYHTLTIKSLTMIKVYHNSINRKRSRTRIGLRRGRIRAKISRKIKTVFQVSTPVATSSVRGTTEDNSYGPNRGAIFFVPEGSAEGENLNGSKRTISGGMVFHQKPGKSEPEDLFIKFKNISIVLLNDPAVTGDEQSGMDSNDDNTTDNNDDPASSVNDYEIENSINDTQVNIEIQWP